MARSLQWRTASQQLVSCRAENSWPSDDSQRHRDLPASRLSAEAVYQVGNEVMKGHAIAWFRPVDKYSLPKPIRMPPTAMITPVLPEFLYMHRPPHFNRRTVLGIVATCQVGMFSRPASASQAEVLAAAEFMDERGTLHHLNELDRPLLLVNLWAAWCPGCVTEMPTMQALTSLLGPDAIDVVLLSHAMNWNGDLTYAHRAGLPFRHWRLSSRVPEAVVATVFRVEGDRFGLPQSLVFAGKRRELVASYPGSRDWTAPEQLRLARGWLGSVG